MKTTKIVYWVSTGLLSLMMGFAAFNYFTNPEMEANFAHLGFPGYFRVELGIAKLLGALALIVPLVPSRLKEWAYAGFTINFVSALVAHLALGDPAQYTAGPVLPFILLAVSYFSWHRLTDAN